jgi:hypothetical protein
MILKFSLIFIILALLSVAILIGINRVIELNENRVCGQPKWSPTNHCDAICYGKDKGRYSFVLDNITSTKGNYKKYICPCKSGDIEVSETFL